jgi:Tfp pilus assembly protein PilN
MIKINLLGDSAKARGQAYRELQLLSASIVALAVLSVLGRLWFAKEAAQLEKQVEFSTREMASVRALSHEVRMLEKQQQEGVSQLQVLEGLFRAKQGTLRIFDALVNSVPERAWLTEIRETDQGLKFSGMAQDGETISKFTRELDKSPVLAAVAIDVAKQSVRQGVKLQEFGVRARRTHGKPPIEKVHVDSRKDKKKK